MSPTGMPVQWYTQPKLDILKNEAKNNAPRRYMGDELAVGRWMHQNLGEKTQLNPTDLYQQDMFFGQPQRRLPPKVNQFGRLPDGRLVLADRGAVQREPMINENAAFTGPQVAKTQQERAHALGLQAGMAYPASYFEPSAPAPAQGPFVPQRMPTPTAMAHGVKPEWQYSGSEE